MDDDHKQTAKTLPEFLKAKCWVEVSQVADGWPDVQVSPVDQPTADRVLRTLTCQCLSIHHSPCSVLCQCARRTCRRCALTRQRKTCSLSRTRWKDSSLLVSLECFFLYTFFGSLCFSTLMSSTCLPVVSPQWLTLICPTCLLQHLNPLLLPALLDRFHVILSSSHCSSSLCMLWIILSNLCVYINLCMKCFYSLFYVFISTENSEIKQFVRWIHSWGESWSFLTDLKKTSLDPPTAGLLFKKRKV